MKAIPMKGKLNGKKIAGFLWARPGMSWTKKENYFQLEHDNFVSAVFEVKSGSFWIRCKGASCKVTLKSPKGKVLGTTTMALPGAKKI